MSGVGTSVGLDLGKVIWFSKQWRLDVGMGPDFLTLTRDDALVALSQCEYGRKELRRA